MALELFKLLPRGHQFPLHLVKLVEKALKIGIVDSVKLCLQTAESAIQLVLLVPRLFDGCGPCVTKSKVIVHCVYLPFGVNVCSILQRPRRAVIAACKPCIPCKPISPIRGINIGIIEIIETLLLLFSIISMFLYLIYIIGLHGLQIGKSPVFSRGFPRKPIV